MILIPRYRDLETKQSLILQPRMSGRYKFTAIRPDGRERPLTGWISNIITDVGLNLLGTTSVLSNCHVGTNNTAATVAQTALLGWIAASNSIQESSSYAQGTAPYFGTKVLRYRFNQGVATGNLNEVGIGSSATNATLWSRAVIVDEFAVPTTITVLSDEVLDVTYELRLYPPLVDGGPATINISGTNYDVTWRAASVTGFNWYNWIGSAASFTQQNSTHTAYNGLMNASITGLPSGTSSSMSMSNAAYSNNSLQRDATVSYNLNDGNLSGGIKSTAFSSTLGQYQFEFNNPIPKDATKTLTLTYRVAWSRYP
jgi:hypothetical protein